MTLAPPEPISERHETDAFDCGESELNEWLRRRALANEIGGASRTYVVCRGNRVVAYYSLSVGSVRPELTPGRVRRNMPSPIPVMLIGRLGVDRTAQGLGLGRALVADALGKTLVASRIAGIRAVLVHALNENARAFYEKVGFLPSPIEPLTLMLMVADIRQASEMDR